MRRAAAAALLCLLAALAGSQRGPEARERPPEAEFHLARFVYHTYGGGGSAGFRQPWWAIDYPLAEQHFLPALRRMTKASVAEDSRHLQAIDARLFEYPFLFMQQPGRGNWDPTSQDAARLREYLLRGGFLLVDDLHGEYDWAIFEGAMRRVFPDRPIVEISGNQSLLSIFFDLDPRIQIPGRRHLRRGGPDAVPQMEGPPHWRGIYDDRGRLMVAINFNIDMGDAWEHADDPYYPMPMTALSYRLGINYVLYAMTH